MNTVTEVRCSEVRTGDRITEVATPNGPWYEVVRESPKSFFIGVDDFEIRFAKSERATILRGTR